MEARALGKGLSALIPEKLKPSKANQVLTVKTENVRNNSLQPRSHYASDKLDDLIASIKDKGILQPILVREKNGGYEVVAGERRLRAAKALKLEEVPVVVRNISDKETLVLALIENIQREDLSPIEEAKAFKRLVDEFGFTQEDVAQSVGKSRTSITNVMRLLRLPEQIQQSVFNGKLSEGHARALLGIDHFETQLEIFQYAVENSLSVRELEQLVKDGLTPVKVERQARSAKAPKNTNVVAVEEGLQKILGTKVSILAKKKRGKIVIEYYSNDDLKRIIKQITK